MARQLKRTTLIVTMEWYFEDGVEVPPKGEVDAAIRQLVDSDLQDSGFRRGVDDVLERNEFGTFYIENLDVRVKGRSKNPIPDMPGGSVSGCIKKVKRERKDIDDPGAYCAAIADRVEPGWRSQALKNKLLK